MKHGRSNRKLCFDCHIAVRKENVKTNKPKPRPTKIKWPHPFDVKKMVDEYGFVKTGKMLGVSDKAVSKFLKRSL